MRERLHALGWKASHLPSHPFLSVDRLPCSRNILQILGWSKRHSLALVQCPLAKYRHVSLFLFGLFGFSDLSGIVVSTLSSVLASPDPDALDVTCCTTDITLNEIVIQPTTHKNFILQICITQFCCKICTFLWLEKIALNIFVVNSDAKQLWLLAF